MAWHEGYDQPGSWLDRRLGWVRGRIWQALTAAPPGAVRVLSMCAGQGRDLLGVLADHPRRSDVIARLVELDPTNAARAAAVGAPGVEVVVGDAGVTDAYEGIAPVDLALVCGVFGNIPDDHIRRTVESLPSLCAPGATVIWTRHREPPDLTPVIREWFTRCGFAEVAFDTEPGHTFGVGTHRLVGPPSPFRAGVRLFEFR